MNFKSYRKNLGGGGRRVDPKRLNLHIYPRSILPDYSRLGRLSSVATPRSLILTSITSSYIYLALRRTSFKLIINLDQQIKLDFKGTKDVISNGPSLKESDRQCMVVELSM